VGVKWTVRKSPAEDLQVNHDDFEVASRPHLQRVPFMPVVVELDDGRRVTIDAPRRLRIGPDGPELLPIGQPPLTVSYSQVRSVTALDDLPGRDGAMSFREVYPTLRRWLSQKPFQPFSLAFVTGERVVVESPEQLLFNGRFGLYAPASRAAFKSLFLDRLAVVEAAPTGVAET
jgi:hypothetical protein